MELSNQGLANPTAWQAKGYTIPNFQREDLKACTQQNPKWIHFGCGNIYKAFIAPLMQILVDAGVEDTGIISIVDNIPEVNKAIYDDHDNLVISVTLNPDGQFEKKVVGTLTHCIPNENKTEIKQFFVKPTLQMVSFTITEKGYQLKDATGAYFPWATEDFQQPPEQANSFMGKIANYLYERFLCGATPVAMVSMDNCAHNGWILRGTMETFAQQWCANGFVPQAFVDYLQSNNVSFPCSMIDKITPRPDQRIEKMLEADGIDNMGIISRADGVYIAPFVNAEKAQYLVIEDNFPNGRPKLEQAGVYFADTETVDKVEKMKVTTCLNPLHTALAVFGCLLGYESIAAEMHDADLVRLIERIGYQEGLPVVVHPGILDPKQFIDEVVTQRLINPFLPDTPQRIACDTSQKIAIRFGVTIQSYATQDALDVRQLVGIPLTIAAWFRYLLGKDDEGNEMPLNPDPMLSVLVPKLAGIIVGAPQSYQGQLQSLLSDEKLFGVNLMAVGLGETIEAMFVQMIANTGAVRQTLHQAMLPKA